MSLIAFLSSVIIISLSGVMAPGPITALTIGKGSKSPHAGALVAIGHGIIEFPLMLAIAFGFAAFVEFPYVRESIGIIGGLFLLYMGVGMLKTLLFPAEISSSKSSSSIGSGLLLSIGNPYFIIWWITVGATMILSAQKFGLKGLLLFMIIHWTCDLIWLYFLSALSYKGGEFFGKVFQKIIFFACGFFLIIFSGKFIYDAVISLV